MAEENIKKIKNLLASKMLPEPKVAYFRKYLARIDLENKSEEDKALIHMCNTNVQNIRDLVNFWRDYNSEGNKESMTPVLNPLHLMEFQTIDEIKGKLREMPSEWTAILLSREFEPMDAITSFTSRATKDSLYISRLPCGNPLNRSIISLSVPPKSYKSTEPNPFQCLHKLMEMRKEFFNNKRNKELLQQYLGSDATVVSLLKEVETYYLQEWKCLLSGRLVNRKLEENVNRQVKQLVEGIADKSCRDIDKCYDIIFQLVVNAHKLTDSEIFKAIIYAVYDGDISCRDTAEILVDNIKNLNKDKTFCLQKVEMHPVILILDNSLELFPWEKIISLNSNPVLRVLSLHLLYALYKYHELKIVNGYRILDVKSAYCLLNPSKDLVGTEKFVGNFIQKNLPWIDLHSGSAPKHEELSEKLEAASMYLYCGHGSGSQYFKGFEIGKTYVNCLALLFGCSSNLPQNFGGRCPFQNDTYSYLVNGCPSLIGCLYTVTSDDIDRVSTTLLTSLFVKNTKGQVEDDVVKALLKSKEQCRKFLNNCALVARGIPVKINCIY